MLSLEDQIGFHDGIQDRPIDKLARALGENGPHPRFKIEVGEKRNIISPLLALGKLVKHQETSPALAFLPDANTLHSGGQRVKIALGDASLSEDTDRTNPSVDEEDEGQHDTPGEYPF